MSATTVTPEGRLRFNQTSEAGPSPAFVTVNRTSTWDPGGVAEGATSSRRMSGFGT